MKRWTEGMQLCLQQAVATCRWWTRNDVNGLSALGLEHHVRQKGCFKLCCWKNPPLCQDQTNDTKCHCCSWSKVVVMPFSEKMTRRIQMTFYFLRLYVSSLQAAAVSHLNIWLRCLCCSSNDACWLYKLAPACEKRRLINSVEQ